MSARRLPTGGIMAALDRAARVEPASIRRAERAMAALAASSLGWCPLNANGCTRRKTDCPLWERGIGCPFILAPAAPARRARQRTISGRTAQRRRGTKKSIRRGLR